METIGMSNILLPYHEACCLPCFTTAAGALGFSHRASFLAQVGNPCGFEAKRSML